jgi:hypothetical protein
MSAEAINSYGVTVGTASTPIVGMSADAQIAVIQNQQPSSDLNQLARDGFLYNFGQRFTVPSSGTVSFGIATGPDGLQIEAYELVSKTEALEARLIEGATVTTSGAAIPAYNLNRNESDAHVSVLKSATAVTGGSAVSKEYLTADKHSASGGKGATKILTLRPSTDYAFSFVNLGNQTTEVFFQATFAEKYNGLHDVWLGGSIDNGVRLRGGQIMQLPMIQGQTLHAVAEKDNQVGVLRQD